MDPTSILTNPKLCSSLFFFVLFAVLGVQRSTLSPTLNDIPSHKDSSLYQPMCSSITPLAALGLTLHYQYCYWSWSQSTFGLLWTKCLTSQGVTVIGAVASCELPVPGMHCVQAQCPCCSYRRHLVSVILDFSF